MQMARWKDNVLQIFCVSVCMCAFVCVCLYLSGKFQRHIRQPVSAGVKVRGICTCCTVGP